MIILKILLSLFILINIIVFILGIYFELTSNVDKAEISEIFEDISKDFSGNIKDKLLIILRILLSPGMILAILVSNSEIYTSNQINLKFIITPLTIKITKKVDSIHATRMIYISCFRIANINFIL